MKTQDLIDERRETHGKFEDTAEFMAAVEPHLGRLPMDNGPATALAARMIALKLARICHGRAWHVDHWRDIAGYAHLVVTMLEHNLGPEGD